MITRVWRLPWMPRVWVDGDTCHGSLDMGWRHVWTPPKGLRLLLADGGAYDAPERKGATLAHARAARERASELVPPGEWVMVTSHMIDPDDFGRPLCSIETQDGRDLAAILVSEGYVKIKR